MKDVFLFPESIMTISDTGAVLSKSNWYDEDHFKVQTPTVSSNHFQFAGDESCQGLHHVAKPQSSTLDHIGWHYHCAAGNIQ
jgi:hypothetical protein